MTDRDPPAATDRDAPAATGRRATRSAVMLTAAVTAAAGLVAVAAAGRVWLRLTATRPAPFPPLSHAVTGRGERPAVAGLAVVAVLAALLLPVAGRWTRTGLALLIMVLGSAVVWNAGQALRVPPPARRLALLGAGTAADATAVGAQRLVAWPTLTLASGVLLALAGGVTARRCRGWAPGLSARYQAPTPAGTRVPVRADDWTALDRGDDPTVGGV